MSGIDQAFIKAFRKDPAGHPVAETGASDPAPHAPIAPPHGNMNMPTGAPVNAGVSQQHAAQQQRVDRPLSEQVFGQQLESSHVIDVSHGIDASHEIVQGPHWSPAAMPAAAAPAAPAAVNEATLPAWARPAYEVERFAWPEVCRQLVSTMGGQLDSTAKVLIDQARAGKQVLYVSGVGQSEGCTTVLLCLAQRLAAIGMKCALVDANFERPGLIQSLGVSPVAGWEDVAREHTGVAEVMVQSEADHMAVLPLRTPLIDGRILANDLQWPVALATLKQHYQIVLIDGPSTLSPASNAITSLGPQLGVDSAILVSADADRALPELSEATNRLVASNVEVLGVIENVCRAVSPASIQESFPTSQIA